MNSTDKSPPLGTLNERAVVPPTMSWLLKNTLVVVAVGDTTEFGEVGTGRGTARSRQRENPESELHICLHFNDTFIRL